MHSVRLERAPVRVYTGGHMWSGPRATILALALAILGWGCAGFAYLVGAGAQTPAAVQVSGIVNGEGDPLSAVVGVEKVDFMPYWRVWNTLERKFSPFGSTTATTTVGREERLYRSIEGLVASYDDPYTVFMRPQVAEDFKVATKGSLEGIGAVIGEKDGTIIVVGPLKDSPADRAGLKSGDLIRTIDGVSTDGMEVNAAVDRIRGEGGTTVTLRIAREGEEERDVPIVRGTIEIPSTAHAVVAREVPVAPPHGAAAKPGAPVKTEKRDFYVLRLFSFSASSINAFERELKAYAENGATSLIIDLRGNPGGYLEAAVNMAGWFLPEGSVVVRDFTGPDRKERVYTTTGHALFADTRMPKIVILVDRGSASASEILAGALQEHGVATLVGTRTFGKGSVQELVNITDTLALKVTVSRWYTPHGRSISNGGLTPDITLEQAAIDAATSSDPWLDAAIAYLTTGATSTPFVAPVAAATSSCPCAPAASSSVSATEQ